MRDMFLKRVGNPSTAEGRAALDGVSPALKASNIEHPLLIAQGANDPLVDSGDTQQVVDALKARNVPVTYLRFGDEAGKLSRPANTVSFYAVVEGFLGHCLGGQVQPIGDDLKGSSVEIIEGASYVPGLIDAMAATSTPQPQQH